ncbi:MAG: tripartite tricarboxylate transporter TctB family protein [Marinosulfonomonas sp.]|nr:tripartite tricarboxylate transporter TctB family protein [Marinosulfonomonas sp.]
MRQSGYSRAFQADNLAAGICILVSSVLLVRVWNMPTMSGLLPIAMLVGIIVLSLALIGRNFFASASQSSQTSVFVSPRRFCFAALSVIFYILAVNYIGFYTSTTIMVPAVAWVFGYRQPLGLALATLLFVGGIGIIFQGIMNRDFPTEFFLN